jgi:pyruvate/2-oxoglutarate dehydrogenase complex dihydrolipoamide acyltransferase (E2) component
MILSLEMPRMEDLMTVGVIAKVYVAEGSMIQPGSRLLDVGVDLSALAPQDCPPLFCFRMVAREKGTVRQLAVSVGNVCQVGSLLALIATEPDEPLDSQPTRPLRVSSVSVLTDVDWSTSQPSF